jgi:hypothetical protein
MPDRRLGFCKYNGTDCKLRLSEWCGEDFTHIYASLGLQQDAFETFLSLPMTLPV